jgi:hypothetical protein
MWTRCRPSRSSAVPKTHGAVREPIEQLAEPQSETVETKCPGTPSSRPAAGCRGNHAALASLGLEAIVGALYEPIGQRFFPSPAAMEEAGTAAHLIRFQQPSRAPQTDIHLLIAAVCLEPTAPCRAAWSFLRHRETGAEALFSKLLMSGRCPAGRSRSQWLPDETVRDRLWRHGAHRPHDEALEAGLVRGYDEYHDRIAGTPRTDGDGDWELAHTVDMTYNRLVVYPGFLLHATELQPEPTGAGCLVQRIGFNWPARPLLA